MNKKIQYSEIRFWKNGKIEVVNNTAGHWENQNGWCSSGYHFTECETKNLVVKKKKFFDKMMKEINKELNLAIKKHDTLLRAILNEK